MQRFDWSGHLAFQRSRRCICWTAWQSFLLLYYIPTVSRIHLSFSLMTLYEHMVAELLYETDPNVCDTLSTSPCSHLFLIHSYSWIRRAKLWSGLLVVSINYILLQETLNEWFHQSLTESYWSWANVSLNIFAGKWTYPMMIFYLVILLMRVYAIWQYNKIVLVSLCILLVVSACFVFFALERNWLRVMLSARVSRYAMYSCTSYIRGASRYVYVYFDSLSATN